MCGTKGIRKPKRDIRKLMAMENGTGKPGRDLRWFPPAAAPEGDMTAIRVPWISLR